jgi:hypothetical protein
MRFAAPGRLCAAVPLSGQGRTYHPGQELLWPCTDSLLLLLLLLLLQGR